MTLALTPFFRNQFFDQNGSPLAGGRIHFMEAGSTSLFKNTYKDYLGASINTNPVVLDSSGVAKIFGSGLYDVWIYDSENALVESILGVNFGGGSGSGFGTSVVVDNYDAVRTLTQDYDLVYVLGRSTDGDGGQGLFQLITSTEADDDGIVLVRESSRYRRLIDDVIKAEWYGVTYGATADQRVALLAALDASNTYNLPVLVTGSVYLASKTVVKAGTSLNLQGSFRGPATPIDLLFKEGSKFQGTKNCLAAGVTPVFERGVCDALYLSWFTNGTDISRWEKASASSQYNYKLLIDVDTNISSNIEVPVNFAIDFVAGSMITVSDDADIVLNNLIYQGVGQIIKYKEIGFIGKVKLGSGYTYLEWFGGVASKSNDTDNSIPFQAALNAGKVYLIASEGYYTVPAGTYSTSESMEFAGLIPSGVSGRSVDDECPSTLRFNGSVVTIGQLVMNSVRFDGYGSITCTGLTSDNCVVSNAIAYSTGLTSANDSISVDPMYVAVGNLGKVINSSDLTNWTNNTQSGIFAFTSIASNGNLYVAVGSAGAIYTSPDLSTWTQRTSSTSANFTKVVFKNGKFVAVGASGIISYSADGISWNTSSVSTSFDFHSVDYSVANSLWIAVGSSGNVYTSADLITWVKKTITGLSGEIYTVHCEDELTAIAGVGGLLYTSTDLSIWYSRIAPVTSVIMTINYYADKKIWVAGTSNGQILTSTDGINYQPVQLNVTLTDSIYDQVEVNGQIVFVGGSGFVLSTFDLKTFTLSNPVNGYNLYGVTAREAKALIVGNSGKIVESTDLVTWTEQPSVTTENINKIVLVNGVYYALGAAGVYLTSRDGTSWVSRSIGSAVNLYDVQSNVAKDLYTMVCAGGAIYTSADPLATSPVWTARTSNVSYDLTKVLYSSSTWYVYGKSGTILKSTNAVDWTNLSVSASAISANGIIANGNVKVYFGANGNIVSTTDGITFTKRVSGTTVNLLDGVFANSLYVIVGQNGTVLTSPDAITWTLRTSGSSAQLNRVTYGNSYFTIAGYDSTLLKSTDGISWSNAAIGYDGGGFPSNFDFNSIKYLYGEWYAVGLNGAIVYGSDLANWSSIIPDYKNGWPLVPPTPNKNWVDVFGSADTGTYAIGAIDEAGYAIQTSNWGAARWFEMQYQLEAGDTFKRAEGDLLVGGSGTIYKISGGSRPSGIGPTPPILILTKLTTEFDDDLVDVSVEGSEYYVISNYTTLKSTDKVNWTRLTNSPSEDIEAVQVDGNKFYLLAGGKLLSTEDNYVFDWIRDTDANNFQKIDSKYLLLNDNSVIEKATTPSENGFDKYKISSNSYSLKKANKFVVNGANYIFYLTSEGKILLGSDNGLAITSTGKAEIYASMFDVDVVAGVAGNITKSILSSVSKVGTCDDTTFSNLKGSIYGNISRVKIDAYQPIGVGANVNIIDSEISQLSKNTEMFSVDTGVSSISMTNSKINLNGMMLYSENTNLIINIYGGFVDTQYALTNGFAKVYLNAVFKLDGTKYSDNSVYSKDGNVFEDILLASDEVISGDLSAWYNVNKSNLELDGSYLKAKEDIPMSNNIASVYALRFRKATTATKMLFELGGKIQLDVEFPAGVDSEVQGKVKLRPVLYTPATDMVAQLNMISSSSFGYSQNTNPRVLTGSSYVSCTKDSAKVRNTAYIWSGSRELGLHRMTASTLTEIHQWWYDWYGDRFAEAVFEDADPTEEGSVIVTKTLPGISTNVLDYIPYIVIVPEDNCVLPKDTKIKLTIIPNITKNGFDLWFGNTVNTSIDSARGVEYRFLNLQDINSDNIVLKTIRNSESALFDEQQYLGVGYAYSYNGAVFYQNPDPNYIFPQLSTLSRNIKVVIEGLKPNATAKMTNTNFKLFTEGHYKPNGQTDYNLLTNTICTDFR